MNENKKEDSVFIAEFCLTKHAIRFSRWSKPKIDVNYTSVITPGKDTAFGRRNGVRLIDFDESSVRLLVRDLGGWAEKGSEWEITLPFGRPVITGAEDGNDISVQCYLCSWRTKGEWNRFLFLIRSEYLAERISSSLKWHFHGLFSARAIKMRWNRIWNRDY